MKLKEIQKVSGSYYVDCYGCGKSLPYITDPEKRSLWCEECWKKTKEEEEDGS